LRRIFDSSYGDFEREFRDKSTPLFAPEKRWSPGESFVYLDRQMRQAVRQGTWYIERYSHASKDGAYALVDVIEGKLYFRAVDGFADAVVKLPIDADE
jgi:hypothetical protein